MICITIPIHTLFVSGCEDSAVMFASRSSCGTAEEQAFSPHVLSLELLAASVEQIARRANYFTDILTFGQKEHERPIMTKSSC